MPAAYREFTYDAPTTPPVRTQAYVVEREGAWRLLIFPGTPARRYLFDRILKRAPEHLETVLVMRPGFEKGAERAYPSFEDQIAAARPFLQDKKVVALGVSYGGELALKCALDHPGRVRGVVTAAALVTEPRGWVAPFVRLGGAPLVRDLLPRTLRHSCAEVAGRREQIAAVFGRLHELSCPATILHGDLDHLVALSDATTLRNYFRTDADVRFDRVGGGTHFLEMQVPDRVLAAVGDVIRRAEMRVRA